eukprot:301583-Amorphochlora_amoeboformis.AAC.1
MTQSPGNNPNLTLTATRTLAVNPNHNTNHTTQSSLGSNHEQVSKAIPSLVSQGVDKPNPFNPNPNPNPNLNPTPTVCPQKGYMPTVSIRLFLR